ncbi:ATP dependent DNA ligase [Trametes versicolor FP-101664 SS1]|uniref:ATP dependent DNA ligase n=1 Tax=Trametes versicolor (strain FP-101664) TaxID=717944 RepID=UPI00046235E0|nr:ATP dependent DNA ligase [Trametes versicolor FP-101664 SS1]EIW63811.1 ATP dependent DNA ligase [Trametes versicolor FP-101664 SS1]
MSLAWHSGCLALVGPRVDAVARAAISGFEKTTYAQYATLLCDPASSSFHITVLTKDELRDASVKPALPPLDSVDTRHLHFVGIGGNVKSGAFFVAVVWPAGQVLRSRVGLGTKHFHITISVRDDHTIDKGFDAVLPANYLPDFCPDDPEFLDHLAFTFHLEGRYDRARSTAASLCKAAPSSERGFLRLADAASKEDQHKLAMLAYACAFQRCSDSRVREYCLKRLEECAQYTEWGAVFTDAERERVNEKLSRPLLVPWSNELRDELSHRTLADPPSLCISSREPMCITGHSRTRHRTEFLRIPRFFRWLVPFYLALMSTPRDEADIDALASPTFGICNDSRNTPMLIHCGGGKGRAGTVAACYLVAYGFARPDASRTEPAMSAGAAIAALRALRPGSIETQQQEDFVARYCSALWKRRVILPELVSEPAPCPLEIEGALPGDADLFILVGLPGAGKSTFARMLMARDPRRWTYVSQDDAGSRSACETALGNARTGARVLLDLCNVARDRRKEWLALAAHWATAPVCVWFDYERALCVSRAQNRAGHPTLPPGNRVRNAMDQMHGMFVKPALEEGFKAVVAIRSFAAAEELVSRLSPPIGLLKFPRTPHLIDLGSATSDDVVLDAIPVPGDGHVVITEKVDGANMGFSLSAERTHIFVQNRSHYINPASHEQFKKLGLWIERHRAGLMVVLDRDPLFAQRYVLYGEWLVATHSIPYSCLPDWFLAFDLYDRSTGRWASRRILEALLADTDICLAPVVHEGRMLGEDELREFVQRPSLYYDGPVEGVYVKVERNGEVVSRGKVVRADFIAGNEHWSKGPLRMNVLQVEDAS